MVPLHFGSSERPLFGVYLPPTATPRPLGVVICPPLPQEAMRTTWTLRRLALALAELGFHALRFDWFGTGDSSGSLVEADLRQWRADLRAAVGELRDLSGGSSISVVGIGIGGSIALTTELAARDLVLWDPVVRGAQHLKQLLALHEATGARARGRANAALELLGYEMGAALMADIAAIDLLQPAQRVAHFKRVAVMSSAPSDEARALHAQLGARELVALPERAPARSAGELLISLLAPESVKRVSSWFNGEAA
ncbi:MAG: alpha/beta hydrolase [Deltaproteobacteria bacterium]|nr:alpha/beta hydrolase [Deltaproteobacteria bacterium]